MTSRTSSVPQSYTQGASLLAQAAGKNGSLPALSGSQSGNPASLDVAGLACERGENLDVLFERLRRQADEPEAQRKSGQRARELEGRAATLFRENDVSDALRQSVWEHEWKEGKVFDKLPQFSSEDEARKFLADRDELAGGKRGTRRSLFYYDSLGIPTFGPGIVIGSKDSHGNITLDQKKYDEYRSKLMGMRSAEEMQAFCRAEFAQSLVDHQHAADTFFKK